ncbi:hypothetical protein THRCLA_22867 [Thraustotheca clavata]|uniref:Uncharacterized protein n=1 Tax=Thraustotheca clavata TaxID=74557 RepID=A0A1V9YRV8_9STRA|nr:hypothetical protein THRCLA_22867 [Thraustotheca clavata]
MEEMQRKEEEERELKAFRLRLEETREKKRRAADLHEQKVIEAVCAASLLEYNEHQRIEKQLHDAEEEIERLKALQQAELNRKRQEAAQQKLLAQQSAENAKLKAKELAEKATIAINAYKDTETHRQEALATFTEQECDRELQAQLHQLKLRQEAATLRRIESERAAIEAQERAARIREEAIAKVKQVRELSKKKITTELTQEEQLRSLQYESQLHQLHAVREEATQRRIDRELQAKVAQERATHLREEAFAKVKQVREHFKTQVSSQLTREDELRELRYQSELQALQSVKDAATIHHQELERAAIQAKEKAERLRKESMAKNQELLFHHEEVVVNMAAQEKQTQAQPAEMTEEMIEESKPNISQAPSL